MISHVPSPTRISGLSTPVICLRRLSLYRYIGIYDNAIVDQEAKDAMEDPIFNWSFPYTHCVCLIKGFKTVLLNSFVCRYQAFLLFVVPFGIWGNLKFIFGDYITSHPFSRRFQEEKKWLNLRKLKLKKKIPNIPPNLKCTVLYVNMLC